MREKLGLIFGIILFVAIIVGMIYLVVTSDQSGKKEVYTKIELKGNHLLKRSDYLKETGLFDEKDYSKLTLHEIKLRIDKHLYVQKSEVESDGNQTVHIKIYEKKMKAVILSGSKPVLITEKLELINLKRNTDISNLPVLTNVDINVDSKIQSAVKNIQLLRAFKIIDALNIAAESMQKSLSEINLRHGGDVILKFSGIKYPVIFGKGNIAKKIAALSAVWKRMIKNDKLFAKSEYIDLRFNNEIFIGKPVTRI